MGQPVRARQHGQPTRKLVARSLAHSAVAAGVAAGIVTLTGIAAWIAVLVATGILVIGFLLRERL